MSEPRAPRILLIGHGRFGREHHIVWQRLAEQGVADLAGIVVATEASRAALAGTTKLPVYCGLDGIAFDDIDAVDIVTPSATHFELVQRLLPLAHVLVEKPLAGTAAQADALALLASRAANILAVGHIYRFHPLIMALREHVATTPERPRAIFGSMLNPASEAPAGADPSMELLHYFDAIDLLFGKTPVFCSAVRRDLVHSVSLRYPFADDGRTTNVVLRLGWEGTRRQRVLDLIYRDFSMRADFADQMITIDHGDSMHRIILPHGHAALEGELHNFVAAVQGRAKAATDAATAARIVHIASRAQPRPLGRTPRVAVIGGGVFGATCAAELGDFCDVTLFERHDRLLAEASTLNQWRYHHGFHYPRSLEMINEIKECRHAFEEIYGAAITTGVDSYYAPSKAARIITGERYLHVCTSMGLAFTRSSPPDNVLDPDQVSLCLRTDEGVFNANGLSKVMLGRLSNRPGITVALGHAVADGELLPDGRKRLIIQQGATRHDEAFDYVVNATYTNRNMLARLFGFPQEPLRFDLMELLLLELDLPMMSVTVLDGPFTSLVSTGTKNIFTLSHIQHSLLASVTPADGIPPHWTERQSNRENLIAAASRYMPILRDARHLGSRYGTRTVNPQVQDVDGRPTVVVDHGFGCWSVLGGKINTSVFNARQIASQIASQEQIDRPGAQMPLTRVTDEGELWRDRSPMGARRR